MSVAQFTIFSLINRLIISLFAHSSYDERSLKFRGAGGEKRWNYRLDLNFYAEVDRANSIHTVNPEKGVEFILPKKHPADWTRLVSEDGVNPWIKLNTEKATSTRSTARSNS